MTLVIKLDDETYKEVMNRTEFDTLLLGIKLIEAVQNGTLLPKEHGRLIDADALDKSLEKEQEDLDLDDKLSNAFCDGLIWASEVLSKEPTIIEADQFEGEG